MICVDFCVIYKYRVKQLMIFEHTVAAASDFKNCTMVNCDKSMGIFPDAQGQLTPQSLVRSGRISKSFEML